MDGTKKKKARRVRLTTFQLEALEENFQKNNNWDADLTDKIAAQLSLTIQKVYKWNWDRKKKELLMTNSRWAQPGAITSVPFTPRKVPSGKPTPNFVREEDSDDESSSRTLTA